MKYIFISDIQWIWKEIHMPKNGIVFHVFMWWVEKNKIWSLVIYQSIWSYKLELKIYIYIYINSHLMAWFFLKR
jgi:hypothetical protein